MTKAIRLTKIGSYLNKEDSLLILIVSNIESITIGPDYLTVIRMVSGSTHLVDEPVGTIEERLTW